MKNELFFLAKMAVVFTVVDGFIPRAETMAKSKMNQQNHEQRTAGQQQSSSSTSSGESKQHNNNNQLPPRYYRAPTEMNMGLFDLNIFHGSGSGGTKESLDEQWEIQQEILRARRGDNTHNIKKRKVGSPNVEIKSSANKKHSNAKEASAELEDDSAHHHHNAASKPKFFWDLGK